MNESNYEESKKKLNEAKEILLY